MMKSGNGRWLFICMVVLLAIAPASQAIANPVDMFGFGARARGMGNAMTGVPSGGAAAYYNMGFLSFMDEVELQVGWIGSSQSLKVNGSDYENLGMANGLDISAGVPFRKKLKWFSLGIAAYIPTNELLRAYNQQATAPQFLMYRNLGSFALYPAISFRLGEYIGLGIGATIFATQTGTTHFTLDIGNQAITKRDMNLGMTPVVAPDIGLAFKYKDLVSAGLSYRGETKMDINLTNVFETEIVQLTVPMYGTFHFSPMQINAGVGYRPIPSLLLAVDASYIVWSRAPDQSLYLSVNADVLLPNMVSPAAKMGFSDVISPKLGIEWAPIENMGVRVGYIYLPTPVPNQVNDTNIADCDKHVMTLGLGYRFKDPNDVIDGIALDAFFQYQFLIPRTIIKKSTLDPVGDYTISGGVPVGGLALKLYL